MRTIETIATVEADGTLTIQVPPDVPPGRRRIVLVLDETSVEPTDRAPLEPFPVLHVSEWGYPADATFRREDLYGDDGR